MSEHTPSAWLALDDGAQIPILGSYSVGRAPGNTLTLGSDKVSRRHALIHCQGEGDFWLVDLGSINGTLVNGRRVFQPTRLSDGDTISIGGQELKFQKESEARRQPTATDAETTVAEIRNVECWLLVADIENFTAMSHRMDTAELATMTGGWLSECEAVVQQHGGSINQYLGDGFFAYWDAARCAARKIADALAGLTVMQQRERPRFRLALHYGKVTVGGMPSRGEASLLGPEVNFVFRMEKLAASLGAACLLSEPANARLSAFMPTQPAGRHGMKGFGEHPMFRV